ADDILNGRTFTFENILPWETEIYIGAFVDFDGNGEPNPGDLLECYEDKNLFAVIAELEDATNVAGQTAITIDLDAVLPE
ncbi:MAG: hypothetical protein JXA61_06800, partial [Bacteroidales bacterium]|nr:hypothetical protein [Bacteroidales bacterium]